MITVGLDVSKGYCYVAILNDRGELLPPVFLVDDTKSVHTALKETIKWAYELSEGKGIKIGFESTGGYEANFFTFFNHLKDEYNLELYRVNPLSVKRY